MISLVLETLPVSIILSVAPIFHFSIKLYMNTALFFDDYYHNAQKNCLMIMNCQGIISNCSQSFSKNFGYDTKDLMGKNFSVLFNELDIQQKKPQQELGLVIANGQADDDNYIIHQKGHEIWCTGESLLVSGTDGDKYIVRDVINLQAKKQVQLFLRDTEELLQKTFESSSEIPMMILDGSMKIENVNQAFLQLFEIPERPPSDSRLSDLDHPFWKNPQTKRDIMNILVANEPQKQKEFLFSSKTGEMKLIAMDSKTIDKQSTGGRLIYILISDITPKISRNRKYAGGL